MIKLTLYCDKCDKEWDRKEGQIDLGNFNILCKECKEAEPKEPKEPIEGEVVKESV